MKRFVLIFLLIGYSDLFSQSIAPFGGWSVYSVSDDGSAFAGTSGGNARGFIGRLNTDSQNLQYFDPVPWGSDQSRASAINSDGSVVVGLFGGRSAFRWTEAGGIQLLGTPYPALAVSGNGETVVGENWRWTVSGGMQPFLPSPTASSTYWSKGVNYDGTIIVGRTGGNEAFRWSANEGFSIIGPNLGRDMLTEAAAVSSDGSVIVGRNGFNAFRWSSDSGIQNLENCPGLYSSLALGVNSSGTKIVGTAFDFPASSGYSMDDTTRAFIWTQEDGMVELSEYFQSAGIDITGWSFQSAQDISADGNTIVGRGKYNNGTVGFVAVLPEPSALSLLAVGLGVVLRQRRRTV